MCTDEVNISAKITQLWFLTLRMNDYSRSSKSSWQLLRSEFTTFTADLNFTLTATLKHWRMSSQIILFWEMLQRCLIINHSSLILLNVIWLTQYHNDSLHFNIMNITQLRSECLSSTVIFNRQCIPMSSCTWSYSTLRWESCQCLREYLWMFLLYWILLCLMTTLVITSYKHASSVN